MSPEVVIAMKKILAKRDAQSMLSGKTYKNTRWFSILASDSMKKG